MQSMSSHVVEVRDQRRCASVAVLRSLFAPSHLQLLALAAESEHRFLFKFNN